MEDTESGESQTGLPMDNSVTGSSVCGFAPPSHKRSMYRQTCRSFQAATHIGDPAASRSQHSARAPRTSSTTFGKSRAHDLPEIRLDSHLPSMMSSPPIQKDTAADNIAPLKRDVALLALAFDALRNELRGHTESTSAEVVHLIRAADAILDRLKSPHLFTGDDAVALRSVDERLTRLAATVEKRDQCRH